MSRLLLALQHSTDLDPAVREELTQLIAAIQTWANVSGDFSVPTNLVVGGYATITGQHCLRAAGSASPATGVETGLALTLPPGQLTDAELFQSGIILSDGDTSAYITQPGLYLLHAGIQWDLSAAGTYRMTQLRVAGVIETGYDRQAPSAAFAVTNHSHYLCRITPEYLATQTNGQVAVGCDVVQDSGGTRSATGWLEIAKIA